MVTTHYIGQAQSQARSDSQTEERGSVHFKRSAALPQISPAFKDLQKALTDDASLFALYVRPDVNSYAPYAGNFKLNTTTLLSTWNVADWFKKMNLPTDSITELDAEGDRGAVQQLRAAQTV